MKQTISGTCTTTNWKKQEYNQAESGPKLTVAEKESTLRGV